MSTQQNPQFDPQTLPTDANKGRESNGRFAKGNSGGPGNPYARESAKMRQAMLHNVDEKDMANMVRKMVELAVDGCVPAAKLVFHYVIGKPSDAVNPDTLDQVEFDQYKKANGMFGEAAKMVHEPDSNLPVSLLRGTREGMHGELKSVLLKGFQKQAEADEARKVKTPIGNGDNGAASTGGQAASGTQSPIGNGDIGNVAPKENGSNGRGPEFFERYGAIMSRRAVRKARKARKAAKLAAMMPSKNGKH